MKTTLHIQFYSDAGENLLQNIALMIAKHNCNKAKLDLNTLAGYYKGYCAQYNYKGEATIIEDALILTMNDKPFINITEHLLIAAMDEENNIVNN